MELTALNPLRGHWSAKARQRLTPMVMQAFKLWELPAADQLALLGLDEGSRASLSRYRHGVPSAAGLSYGVLASMFGLSVSTGGWKSKLVFVGGLLVLIALIEIPIWLH